MRVWVNSKLALRNFIRVIFDHFEVKNYLIHNTPPSDFLIGYVTLLNSMALKLNTKLRILEFIVAGILLDLTENVVSIKLTTQAELTPMVFLIALVVVVPFAIITELIIDHPNFWHKILRIKRK